MMVVKVGGGRSVNLEGVASDLAELAEPVVVVHGANACRDELAARLGRPTCRVTSESGIESVLTDRDALEVLTMAYAGLVNKRFVSLCQQKGVNAVGLTGLDGGLVRGRRNPGIRVAENGRRLVLHDLSGKPDTVNVKLLELLLDAGYTPVVTVPILDEGNCAINTENDEVVVLLQKALGADTVVQLIESPGLLRDPERPESLLRSLTPGELSAREREARGRYRRKLMALRKMLDGGCRRIVIGDGRIENPLRSALAREGTSIQ